MEAEKCSFYSLQPCALLKESFAIEGKKWTTGEQPTVTFFQLLENKKLEGIIVAQLPYDKSGATVASWVS